MNYFELYGLPQSPVADKAAAAKKYIELQKKFHPDFFTNENEADREDAEQQSAHINKAYHIFQNPERTIEYFLQQKGVITPDEKYNLPPDFLMEMMELNESFDESDPETVKKNVTDYESSLSEEIKPLLSTEKAGSLTDAELQELKSYYYRKKYLKRILERLPD